MSGVGVLALAALLAVAVAIVGTVIRLDGRMTSEPFDYRKHEIKIIHGKSRAALAQLRDEHMSNKMKTGPDFMTIDILKAIGVDWTRCHSVTYHHDVGESPTVTVGRYVTDEDGRTLTRNHETATYRLLPVRYEVVETGVTRYGWTEDDAGP